MRCSNCSSDNREGRRYCTSCGTPLAVACTKCGAPTEPGERFCGDCGTSINRSAQRPRADPSQPQILLSDAIPTSDARDGERKTVTALFADIKGSMELM